MKTSVVAIAIGDLAEDPVATYAKGGMSGTPVASARAIISFPQLSVL